MRVKDLHRLPSGVDLNRTSNSEQRTATLLRTAGTLKRSPVRRRAGRNRPVVPGLVPSPASRVAFLKDTITPYIDENATQLRRHSCDGDRLVNAVGALRSGIDCSGDTIAEAYRRPIFNTRDVSMVRSRTWLAVVPVAAAIIVVTISALRSPPTQPAASQLAPLTAYPGYERHPTFSRDGTQIEFVRPVPGAEPVYLTSIAVSRKYPVREGPDVRLIHQPFVLDRFTSRIAARDNSPPAARAIQLGSGERSVCASVL